MNKPNIFADCVDTRHCVECVDGRHRMELVDSLSKLGMWEAMMRDSA